jgi:hypothetical protein
MVVNGDVHCCQKAPSMLLIVTFVHVVGVVGDGFFCVSVGSYGVAFAGELAVWCLSLALCVFVLLSVRI